MLTIVNLRAAFSLCRQLLLRVWTTLGWKGAASATIFLHVSSIFYQATFNSCKHSSLCGQTDIISSCGLCRGSTVLEPVLWEADHWVVFSRHWCLCTHSEPPDPSLNETQSLSFSFKFIVTKITLMRLLAQYINNWETEWDLTVPERPTCRRQPGRGRGTPWSPRGRHWCPATWMRTPECQQRTAVKSPRQSTKGRSAPTGEQGWWWESLDRPLTCLAAYVHLSVNQSSQQLLYSYNFTSVNFQQMHIILGHRLLTINSKSFHAGTFNLLT